MTFDILEYAHLFTACGRLIEDNPCDGCPHMKTGKCDILDNAVQSMLNDMDKMVLESIRNNGRNTYD